MARSLSLAQLGCSTLVFALGTFTQAPLAHAQDVAPPPPLTLPPPSDPNVPGAPGSPSPGTPEQQEQQATVQQLDTAEREDSGRRFELIYGRAEVGGTYINMSQFSSQSFQVEKAPSGGPMAGLAVGVRLVAFIIGFRARYNALSSFNMWQLNLETGLKLPIKTFDILVGLHGGYSFVGSLGNVAVATSTSIPTDKDAVQIRGFNAGLDVGVDYYITHFFSVGAAAFGDFLYLTRPPLDLPPVVSTLPQAEQDRFKQDPLYQQSGTSFGFGAGGALRASFHFGL